MLDSIFDTNVLVAGLRSRNGASHQLLRLAASGKIRLHISVALALEYEDVLKRPDLLPGITVAEVDRFLSYLFSISNLEESVVVRRPNLRDPDDESILELAVLCKATIVTHNVRDFAGSERLGVMVLTPRQFLKQMGGSLA